MTPDDALIEAISEALCSCSKIGDLTIEMSDLTAEDQEFTRDLARAAYAAMVEHLELTEERDIGCGKHTGPCPGRSHRHERRRLVSRWTEVQP